MRQLTPFIGVEFTDVAFPDLRDDAVFDELVVALHRHDLVVVRGLDLTPEQQLALASRLGEPVPFVLAEFRHPDFPQILVSSNETRRNRPVGIPRVGNFWHQDSSFTQQPAPYTMLHGVRVPATSGHTHFASAFDVYDRLPDEWKDLLEGRIGRHTLTRQQRIGPEHVGLSIAEMKALVAAQYPAVEHPVVQVDPDTGRRYLYASREYMDCVVGLDANQNAAFFDLVDALVQDPEHVYVHRWTPADLLIWRTATTYHVATEVAPGVPRTVHRVSIAVGADGPRRVPAAGAARSGGPAS
ncbi:TauD/TfdA family dioxygenase [Micromonospora sp. R77]|uniref:TauD/TfdA dioxygenase family protein n=1 Tax=Micromonospora sp. R77 TaxID=2925836 RepID=UPI001F61682E|nr:TauD/TfdA family dioxygenase [Micromonospora sp. R77]MCI4066886.1 TauD/TfdA family dioxygenase [Micromonospora sp. R77]